MPDTTTKEQSRFGITVKEFTDFRGLYDKLLSEEPTDTQSDGIVLRDWEAAELKKVFDYFKETDPKVCAVLAHMMWYVTDRNNVHPR